MLTVKIGADPEFFLKSKKTGKIVSAHDIVPGTKADPHPMKNGGFIQADGTAVEFNIPASSTAKEFANNIDMALTDIGDFVDRGEFDFCFKPHVKYPKKYFQSLPSSATALGCDPDYNAYTMMQNTVNELPEGVRTGSGHLHIGFGEDQDTKDPEYFASCAYLVRFLDATLATEELRWCNDKVRPLYYGKAGNFRTKRYGLEYRTLSNAWLAHPQMWESLFERTVATVQQVYDRGPEAKIMNASLIHILNKKQATKIHWNTSGNFVNFYNDIPQILL